MLYVMMLIKYLMLINYLVKKLMRKNKSKFHSKKKLKNFPIREIDKMIIIKIVNKYYLDNKDNKIIFFQQIY